MQRDAQDVVAVDVRPRRVLIGAVVTIVVLVAMYAAGIALRRSGHDAFNTVPLTDMNHEMSVPTWVATMLMASVAVALLVVSISPPPGTTALRWRVLAGLAALLSIDDLVAYHETWVAPVRARLDPSGFLLQAWVIPGMVLVAIVALSQVRFLTRLPRPTAIGLTVGTAVFLAGALGMEMIGAELGERWRTDSVGYEALVAVEESLELLGAALVLHALLRHLAAEGTSLLLRPTVDR